MSIGTASMRLADTESVPKDTRSIIRRCVREGKAALGPLGKQIAVRQLRSVGEYPDRHKGQQVSRGTFRV